MTDWAKTAHKNIAVQYRDIHRKVWDAFQNCEGENVSITFTPQELVHLMKLTEDAANSIDRKIRIAESEVTIELGGKK